MIDSLSPLFTDRNTRLAAFPDEQRLAFEALEKNSGDPMFADRQLASIWMSKRTGLPQEEVLKNFDGLASRYFGEGATATQAYDRISELYKVKPEAAPAQGEEGAARATESPYSVSGTVIAKDIAGSLPGGAARMGYDTLGGFYANLAAATGVRLKRPQDDPEYQVLDRRRVLANDPTAFDFRDEEMGFGVAADEAAMEADGAAMQVIRDRVQAENMAALDAASGTFKQAYSNDARKIADTMYGLSKASLDAFGVRKEFQETAVGELLANAGSLPVTALMAAMGPIIGPGLTFSGIYGHVEQERMQVEGKNYDPTGAWLQNLASAGPQAAMEYAFGVERIMANIVKMSPRVGGKIMFGDAARLMGKTGLAGGIEEGLTEPAQGQWNDWMASLTYDEKRELFTEEKLKQRLLESASGFFLGFFFAGGLQGVQILDRNKAVTQSERFLLTREGKPIDGPDFAALRTVKTDEELRAMAPNGLGDMLVGAANGNVDMQMAYRQETLRQAFVDTDGLTVQGLTIGKIGDEVGLRDGSGRIIVIDQSDPKQVDFLKQLQTEAAARDATTQATIDEMKRRFGNLLEVDKRELPVKLSELRKKGLITKEQEADALAAAVYINEALSEDATDGLVMGSARLTQSETDNILRMVINVAQGADPTVAVEELAEAWKKKGIVEGKLDELKLRGYREQWHKDNNEADPAADGRVTPERADTEWFSKRVIDYALANRKTELPGGWGDWLRTLGDRLRKLLRGATRMKKMLREGKISPELEGWFREALGASPNADQQADLNVDQQAVTRNNTQAELEAVFAQLPPEAQMVAEAAQQALLDFEKLKNEYRQQEALQMQAAINDDRQADAAIAQGLEERMRALDFARAKAETAIDEAMNLPASTQLSAQAQEVLDEWESYSLSALNGTGYQNVGDMTFNLFPIHDTIIKALVAEEGTIQEVETDPLEGGKVRSIAKFFQGMAKANERIDWQRNWRGAKRTFPKGQEQKFQKDVDRAATRMVEVLRIAKAIFPNFQSWYESRLKMAMDIFAELDEDAKKPEHNFILRSLLAITSNGNKVNDQTSDSWRIYKEWKKVGKLDNSESISGTRSGEIRKALSRLDDLIQDNGWEKVDTFLKSTGTVAELRNKLVSDFGFTEKEAKKATTGELVDEVVPFSLIFGPKLGSFFNNLSGNFNTTTMDRWFMRTFGRALGYQLTKIEREDIAEKRKRLEVALENAAKTKEGISVLRAAGLRTNSSPSNSTTIALNDYFVSSENREGIIVDSPVDELRKAANGLFKVADGFELEEAPQSGAHRRFIRLAMEKARATFSAETNLNWNAAELQAILWYFEKLVHDTYGSKQTDSTPDYGSAANKLFQGERGGADAVAFKPSDAIQRGAGERGRLEQLARASETSFNLAPTDPTLWDSGTQEITSAKTSINQSKMPATFSRVEFAPGTRNADIGGGSFDNATEYLKGKDVENVIFDPFNRTKEANDAAVAKIRDGQSDTATVNNVLNVIQEPGQRSRVIAQAANAIKPDGTAYFLIYEGNADGAGKKTKIGTWQENRKAADYIDEIGEYFSEVKKAGNLLVATGPQTDESATTGQVTFSLDYLGDHTAPDKDSGAPLSNLVGIYPADVYSYNGLRYYGTGDDALDRQAYAVVSEYKDRPNRQVAIYRAVPKTVKDGINVGDWVTTVRAYATAHGRQSLNNDFRIIKKVVYARDIFTAGDSWLEWGYDPQPFDKEADKARREQRNAANETFALTPVTQIDTAAFKAWFGASKVVDAQGNPMVVYHGTDAKFDVFQLSLEGAEAGIFLTNKASIAGLYGKRAVPVYVSLKNPKIFYAGGQTKGQYGIESAMEQARAEGRDGLIIRDLADLPGEMEDELSRDEVRQYTGDVIIAFAPTQIKSATGNRGTFDATNPDITFALTPTPASRAFDAIYAKQAAMFPYPYHRISSTPTQARVSLGGHEAGLLGRALLPMSERLRFIADRAGSRTGILYRARRYYSEKGTNLKRYSDEVTPLMRGLAKMSTQDMKIFKAAASNQDALQRDNVIAKYGLQSEWASYEAARDSLRAEMIAAGMEVGDIGEYFPRWVKDVTGLRESFGMDASDQPLVQAVIDAEKKAGRALTDEEVNAVLDGAIRGVRSGVIGGAAPSNTKQRKIATIADTQLDFYADPNHALSRWLNQSTEAIARYRFFGKDGQPSTVFPSQIDLDVSIGSILREEVASGNLAATAQMEVKAMLDGLFAYHGKTNGYIRGFIDLSYWATMGRLSSSLAQATDVMISVYEAGPWNTAMALSESMFRNAKNLPGIGNSKTMSEAVANFTKGKNWLTREDLGVDRIMDEFNNQSFTTAALNQVFTSTGLNFMDGIGKDTLLNAKFQQLAKQAKRSAGLSASNQKMIEQIFGKAKARQVIADFRAGTKNADTIFTVYNVLADWQPISLLEYPEVYAKNPNGRVLYMLKSYSIKMLAAYRREGFMKMWYGSPEQKIEGARNLAYLLAMLFMAGVSKDWLVDFLLDRDPQLEDVVVDNVFKLAQVSRYAVWQQRNRAADMGVYGGVGAAAQMAQNTRQIITDLIAPPTVLIERPAKDVGAWAKAKAEYEPWTFWQSESVQFIPIAGEIIYWTGPTGQAKIERRRKLRDE